MKTTGWVKKIYPQKLLQFFCNGWEFLIKILHAYCMLYIYTKLQNFIQLCLILTKLRHYRPVTFYISLGF